MREKGFHPPEAAAMASLLSAHASDATGVVLLLAWRQGLTRAEIHRLTWNEVDFEGGLLRLPDREVPLETETAEKLRLWKKRCEKYGPYVATSDRSRRRMALESLSVLVRRALDEAGLDGVRLQDLRSDYVLRQFKEHDWPYALRVSGLSVTTYRNELAGLFEPPDAAGPAERDDPGTEFRLWRVLQTEKSTPAGIALWLSSQLGLRGEEIAALTWGQIDFEGSVLRLPDREAPLTASVRRVLEAERARRRPEDDPHVLLTPKSRRPMTAARLTTLVRTALIRGGIEDRSMADFRRNAAWEDESGRLMAFVAERGSVSRGEAMALLGVSEGVAYRRLLALCREERLVRLGSRYYPHGSVVRPEGRKEAIRAYIAENGPAYCQDISSLLHVGKSAASHLLRRMVKDGDLVMLRRTKRYDLPREEDAEASDGLEER